MAFSSIAIARTFFRPKKTATAGTAITTLVPPVNRKRTKLEILKYTAAATAHTLTVMAPLAKTQVYSAAAAAATSLVLKRDPGNYSANATADGKPYTPSTANNLIAANDYIAVQKPDGTWLLTTPSAASTDGSTGRVTLTVSALPTGGINANADVYFFGITTDTNPNTGEAHPQFAGTDAVTTTHGTVGACLVETANPDEPLVIYSNNATNAGTLEQASGTYGE